MQYNHLIHTAAQTYIWDNVYLYDKDFRLHLSEYPLRNLGILLQQDWTVRMREKIKIPDNHRHASGHSSNSGRDSVVGGHTELCKRWNQTGRCNFGKGCKFEYRCSYCFKFGHAVINCRKLKYDKQGRNDHNRHDNQNEGKYDRFDKIDKMDFDRKGSGGGKRK